ncbi:aminotransferase class I/II-fold pyridoxal phosphate-dependent enzyme [Corynebacterium poyangense]|uniref:aminotransferase class I/II-fold pyridoxal phosphate-dependent enzyme n=1 Tax=Corynebacterium poyangense TaxID=2684405 RepID=UPI001CCA634E|nr:8-amino-7-oxononanoate synthase [Corynebacterium poyangense]
MNTQAQPNSLEQFCAAENHQWRSRDLERTERVFFSPQTPEATIDEEDVLLFASSNYLGLATDQRVIAAAQKAAKEYGAGSGGSRLTTGTQQLHQALESDIAEFLGAEDSIFFATGYQANLSTIAAVAGPDTLIISDELNHASIIDGARLAKAQVAVFPHGNLHELEQLLASRVQPHALIVSDGLFSMHSTYADVAGIQSLATRYQAWTMIDDAHAIGTVGKRGRGCVDLYGFLPDLLIGTASKALGAEGGFVVARQPIIHYLRNRARSYIFSTAPSPITVASVRAALHIVRDHPELVHQLQNNARFLSTVLTEAGLLSRPLDTPIIPVPIGHSAQALAVSEKLRDAGFFAPAIRYPTVKEEEAIIRITVMATHRTEQLRRLADELISILRSPR